MPQGLTRPKAIYHFRRRVPEPLRAHYGRGEITFSLKTANFAEAKRLAAHEWCRLEEEFAKLRQGAPNANIAAPVALDQQSTSMTEREIEAMQVISRINQEAEWEDERLQEAQDNLKLNLQRKVALTADELAMRGLLREAEFETTLARERQTSLRLSTAQSERKIATGNETDTRPPSLARAPLSIRRLFQTYVDHRRPSPATVKAWRPVIDHFVRFVGHDDASRLTEDDVRGWRDALLAERKPNGEAARGGKTVRETHIAALRVILDPGHSRLSKNVAAGVRVRVPPRLRLRGPDFTLDEALTILRASLAPQNAAVAPETAFARRWVPWLCAYTGARVNELTQLRGEDVTKRDGIWTINITPEAGSVKTSKARLVPLHVHLIEQGFIGFVEEKGVGPLFYDPNRARGGSEGNPHVKKVGERLASWVRSIGVADRAVQPNHAWRHLFVSTARGVGMDTEARNAILGHSAGSEGAKYGSVPLSRLAAELAKFPRWPV